MELILNDLEGIKNVSSQVKKIYNSLNINHIHIKSDENRVIFINTYLQDNKFIFYFNGVEAQTYMIEHYDRIIPLHVLSKPLYKVIRRDNNLFCKENQVNSSDIFYEYKDERYYFAKCTPKER